MTMEATNSEFLWLFEPFGLLPEYGLLYCYHCLFNAWGGSSVNIFAYTSSCWLSSGDGTHAIWTFVPPMLAIISVSVYISLEES